MRNASGFCLVASFVGVRGAFVSRYDAAAVSTSRIDDRFSYTRVRGRQKKVILH